MTKREQLAELAKRAGLNVRTYSPGDGVTRYRFFYASDDSTYFGPSNGLFTALGIKEAMAYVQGSLSNRIIS